MLWRFYCIVLLLCGLQMTAPAPARSQGVEIGVMIGIEVLNQVIRAVESAGTAVAYAKAKTDGPDGDDLAVSYESDLDHGLDWSLDVDTPLVTGSNSTDDGTERPYTPGDPHYAKISLHFDCDHGTWHPDPGDNPYDPTKEFYGWVSASPDDDPEGDGNVTKAMAFAAFAADGKTVDFCYGAAKDDQGGYGSVEKIPCPRGGRRNAGVADSLPEFALRQGAVFLVHPSRFAFLPEGGDSVRIHPLLPHAADILHTYLQQNTNKDKLILRRGLDAPVDSMKAEFYQAWTDTLDWILTDDPARRADLTIVSAALTFDDLVLSRSGHTNRELLFDYFTSNAVTIAPSEHSQIGYVPQISVRSVVTSAQDISSLVGRPYTLPAYHDSTSAERDALIGLFIVVDGGIDQAVTLGLNTGGSFVRAIADSVAGGAPKGGRNTWVEFEIPGMNFHHEEPSWMVDRAIAGTGAPFQHVASCAQPIPWRDESPYDEIIHPTPHADTTWFGGYAMVGGESYAQHSLNDKPSVIWTFDRGDGPPGPPPFIPNGQGWKYRDLTENLETHFRVIDSSLNLGDYPPDQGGWSVAPPILAGAKSLWVGIDKPGADALCWTCGAGYGNDWCQEIVSEPIAYNGAGTVNLSMLYFNDSELCHDGTQIYLRRADSVRMIMNKHTETCNPAAWDANGGFTGVIGVDSLMPPGTPWLIAPVSWTSADFGPADITGGAQNINFVIQFASSAGLSDEDCRGDFIWGPFACDNVHVGGTGVTPKTWTFETGLEGWIPGVCAPVGDYTNVVYLDPGVYQINDPCICGLQGNVLEMHTGDLGHPTGQHEWVESPICDTGNGNPKTFFLEMDLYADLPLENGVLIRPGWRYYPYVCPLTETVGWSPRVGPDCYYYTSGAGRSGTVRFGGTAVSSTAQMTTAIFELLSECSAFGIETCSRETNFTPLLDNLAVGVTGGVNAPPITFEEGGRFQDVGSFPSNEFDVRAPGPANTTYDKNMEDEQSCDKCGDSLIVVGPYAVTDPNYYWEAKMWWRVARRGAFQADRENGVTTAYKIWKDRVSDGKAIDRPYKPEFTYGIMDSVQVASVPLKNRFLSRFSERDDDYLGESKASDMLPDDIFRPGTRIEYFLTANYMGSPNNRYYLPDTTGANFLEFEILPGVRTACVPNCGGTGFNTCAYQPATLYIDAYNCGAQIYIENALRTLLNGYPVCTTPVTGCTIPYDRNWDRYDYFDASTNWNAPFARGLVSGSNNGMTLNQILGYRAILVNTGTYSSGAMEPQDFKLFDEWLTSPDCSANANRQVFAMNGDQPGDIMDQYPQYAQPFFANTLAATLYCNSFNGVTSDADCSPEEQAFCVRLQQVGASPPYFPTLIDVDAYGSWCPNLYSFNVFDPDEGKGGVGNRTYLAEEGGKAMQYEQVIHYNSGIENYKTILDGVSWHHMTKRNAAGAGVDKCPTDLADIVEGAIAELRAALRWGFDVGSDDLLPKLANVQDLATCQLTWSTIPADVGEDAGALRVNRLFQNEPNPFSPRTTIKFSLAQSGPVQIMIYDVNGRQVRKLVDTPMDPGSYSVIWDGTNDSNHRVGSGVYWSQMKAGSFVSNKKMVVLK